MASSLAAFRGKFGSTEFFVLTMRAGEFVRTMTVPRELDGWDDLTPEEKFQREINYKRVATHIAPYLANDKDRFIGAFIVEVRQHDEMEFESLVDAGAKFPKALPNSLMNQFGILYLSGSEIMVPLDGQHRLKALEFAISGKNEKQQDIPGFKPNPEVAEDTCTVILIKHDLEKARKIFNKVNKYAKPTSKADNLITDDSDYIAIITREHVVGGHENIIPARLVKTGAGNTLTEKSPEFTTLATVYEINLAVEELMISRKPNVTELPSNHDYDNAVVNIKEFWGKFLQIEAYRSSLSDPSEDGDAKRSDIRKSSVICKPIAQRALAEAIILMMADETSGKKFGYDELIGRINQVDWDPDNPMWQGILMNGNKVIAGQSPMKFASRVIAYLLGQKLEKIELEKLASSFSENTREGTNPGKRLPDPLFN